MAELTILPHNLTGTVQIPSSKSMGHRALICQALAGGGTVQNLSESQDIAATRGVLAELLSGRQEVTVDCGESGSTLRFLIPVALALGKKATFTGSGKLGERPLRVYYDLFDAKHIKYDWATQSNLPLTVEGQLQPGFYTIPGNVSSQFVSGLLFALPLLFASSELNVTGRIESASYIGLTLKALEDYGIKVEYEDFRHFHIPGRQKYQVRDYKVEGDFSQAAFFLVAGTLGGPVKVKGLRHDSLQGDRVIIDIIRRMGGRIEECADGYIAYPAPTFGTRIDAQDCPDLVPVLAVLAALSTGTTEIYNASRLRFKESDRLEAISTELSRLGAKISQNSDGLIIHGAPVLTKGNAICHNDHRIAMALAVAAIRAAGPVNLVGTECVAKSYPDFWKDYEALGGKYE